MDSFAFGEVQIANNGKQSKQTAPLINSRAKLCMELSLVQNRDNIEFYLHCKFQSLPSSVRRKNGVTDRTTGGQRDYSMPRGSTHQGIMQ